MTKSVAKRIGTQTRGVPAWLSGPVEVAASTAQYLCDRPDDQMCRRFVQRVLLEVERDAREREDAETCATAVQLRWVVEDDEASREDFHHMSVELQNLGRQEIWLQLGW